MRTVRDVIQELDGSETGLSSYATLAPVYDFINEEHFDYDRQETLAANVYTGSGLFVELGCGSGQLLSRIHHDVDEALGVDMSRTMLNRAAARTDARLVQGDVRTPVLSTDDVGGVAMLGRVFSKLRTDDDIERFANATGRWTAPRTELVFNTFRRQDLVDGMKRTQEWERNGIRVVRDSRTELQNHIRDGLFEITMQYRLSDLQSGVTRDAQERFTLRGYDVSDIRTCLEGTPFRIESVEPNPPRSTHFVTLQREG